MIIIILLIFGLLQNLSAQNQAPVVSNVGFYERTDGSFFVDIYYDLFDAENDTMQVSISVSSNEGHTWDFPADSVWGDIGEGVTSATGKHIFWNFGAEHTQFYSDSIQIKIIADDVIDSLACPGTPTVTYAGKIYNTVQIGTQCWLKENLDVGTMISSNSRSDNQTDNGIIEKYCYNNNPNNCTTYGGFYQWNEAMQYVTTEGTQGICPTGWHIPTYAEMQTLKTYVNGETAKLIDESQTMENGLTPTNETGFSALFAGYRYFYNGDFQYLGYNTYIRSSTENGSSAYVMILNYNYSDVYFIAFTESGGFSVRCLKD